MYLVSGKKTQNKKPRTDDVLFLDLAAGYVGLLNL